MHILHVITGLNNGGAEAVLFRLCTNDLSNRHTVISLMDLGKYGPILKDKGVNVYCLNMPQGKLTIRGLIKLYKLLKKQKPDVVQTWMYHADLIGGVIARLAGVRNVFWNIRQSNLEKGLSQQSTIYIAKLCAFLSYVIPKKILCCANNAADIHVALGYRKKIIHVIGNGYELDNFMPDVQKKYVVQKELSITDTSCILGMVGRYDPQKDHASLLRALSILQDNNINFKCLLIGHSLNKNNTELMSDIDKNLVSDKVFLLDQRTDVPAVMNALDIHILSSSYGEGFPNVLAEAMACGTPCVSTDVGDAGLIIGETGWVVPPRDSGALAAAIETAANERNDSIKWQARKESARQRIVENFSVEKMVESYKAAWSV